MNIFTNWKLSDRISLGYALPALFLVAFSTLVISDSIYTSYDLHKARNARTLIIGVDEMILDFNLMPRHVKGYLLTGFGFNEGSIEKFNRDRDTFHRTASDVEQIIKKNTPEQEENFQNMLKLESSLEELAKKTIQIKDQGKQLEATQLFLQESRDISQQFNKLQQDMRTQILDDLNHNNQAAVDIIKLLKILSIVVPLAALIAALVVAYGITTQIEGLIRKVQKSGVQITTSSTEIAASGKQLEATMTEQAASTNEVTATAREIAATSGQLVKTMDEVEDISKLTAQSAGASQKELLHMEGSMQHLADATLIISTKLGVISDKAGNINNIVNTITKVADQTNLLSLNAAIEAEKAGEYGTGFAVVAREIRRLADQTAVATLDIENMVKEMQTAVSTGVMEMDKFSQEVKQSVDDVHHIGEKLAVIIEQVKNLTPRFQEVSDSVEGQSQGAVQISQAMTQLSEASSETVSSLSGINQAITHLNNVANSLRQEVDQFKID